MLFRRVVPVLLAVALVSAGGLIPSARAPLTRRIPRQRELVERGRASVEEFVRLDGQALGTSTLVGDRHHHLSAALETVAVARASVRVGATLALVELREAGVAPDPPGQPVPVAANTRPSRQPRVVLAARAPPV